MPKEPDTRPQIPMHLNTVMADEAADLIEKFKDWYCQPGTRAKVEECVPRTRDFLLKYDHTPTIHGGIGECEPWIRLEDVPLPDLDETDDQMRLDLRFSALRLKTFAEGASRFLGILNEIEGLPKNANSYNDKSTNLAEWFLHERLMRTYLQLVADGKDPKDGSSVKLQDLLHTYLYQDGAQQGPIRAKVVQMVSLGLWDADPPTNNRAWRIRAGIVAVRFHYDVFTPVVAKFKPYLTGGYSKREAQADDL
ncbi:hypothetical protein RHSP_80953 [Rhizobium freirei PRF 81]|uniref:Uncharacterized protein n=1 Tax=Rhizobium freirei PRF 81 TaxID=363754 RepID=N6UHU5_9HYPH|nr:hypothetical protein [Rhizobium freirei]ENN89818.1 hypothetical protein RHSP_80953 [Rhizobium freirei PRF 81]